jgi:regulatory protein
VVEVTIEIDGEAFVTCNETIVSEFRLFDGRDVDQPLLDEIHERVLASEAMLACVQAVSRRSLTERELADKLRAKGHGDSVVDEAIERARHLSLVDDAKYAREFVGSRLRRGIGARRIQSDLARRGVARDVIQHALDNAGDADGSGEGVSAEQAAATAATTALQRKFRPGALDDEATRAKAQRHLLTRGFSYAQAAEAIRTHRAGE